MRLDMYIPAKFGKNKGINLSTRKFLHQKMVKKLFVIADQKNWKTVRNVFQYEGSGSVIVPFLSFGPYMPLNIDESSFFILRIVNGLTFCLIDLIVS